MEIMIEKVKSVLPEMKHHFITCVTSDAKWRENFKKNEFDGSGPIENFC